MQDIHSIGGGGGGGARLFGGGGDRRLRPHGHHHQNNQALKCPRCDSLNTKFCYYNNYNLSQPRHFCKSCRRYWTKGGVLRNVPVGGGCRKTKRSKPKQLAPAASVAETVPQQQQQHDAPQERNDNNNNNSSNSHTSSESSSLTATNTTTATTANTTVEAVSSKASNNNGMFKGRIEVETSKLFGTNASFEQGNYEQYPEIGSFTGMMSSSSSENMSFGFGNVMSQPPQTSTSVHDQHQSWLIDQTVQAEMQHSGSRGGGGFGALDWQGSGDQGLFDIPTAADQAYWTQNQWSADQDHNPGLYLP